MECGKHDILPVAGAIQDHARLPVMMPRESDSSMCRDGPTTAQTVPSPPSLSPEECTARPDVSQETRIQPQSVDSRVYSSIGVHWRPPEKGRRSCRRRKRGARLRGQDKSREVRAGWGRRLGLVWAPLSHALRRALARCRKPSRGAAPPKRQAAPGSLARCASNRGLWSRPVCRHPIKGGCAVADAMSALRSPLTERRPTG